MKNTYFLGFALSGLLVLSGCGQTADLSSPSVQEDVPEENVPEETSTEIPSDWKLFDQGGFSFYAPATWTPTIEQSTDSSTGNFSGDGMTLIFDYSIFSDTMEGTEDYDRTEKTIHGAKAIILTPKMAGTGATMIYFDSPLHGNSLLMGGNDLTAEQQSLALQIFDTIEFKE